MDWIRRGLLVLSVVALVGACGDDESPEPTTTTAESTTTSEATTTTAPPPDPSVIPADPADIDEAYVEAVLAELFHVDGETYRIARREGASPELAERIMAIYEGQLANDRAQLLAEAIANGFEGFAEIPGDVTADVVQVILASHDCIAVEALVDATAVGPAGQPDAPITFELVPASSDSTHNPTSWVITVIQPTQTEGTQTPCSG